MRLLGREQGHNFGLFYNNSSTSTTSLILGKWAVISAVAAFRLSRIIVVNLGAYFTTDCWFPFLDSRNGRMCR